MTGVTQAEMEGWKDKAQATLLLDATDVMAGAVVRLVAEIERFQSWAGMYDLKEKNGSNAA